MVADRKAEGFTLIEIAVVLAIMGIVLVAAVPTYRHLVLRARVGEAHGLLHTIAHAEQLYFRDHGGFIACEATPAEIPGPRGVVFDGSEGCWPELGFSPDGAVLYRYSVEVEGETLKVIAEGDLDGDGTLSRLTLDHEGVLTTERELE